MIRFSFILILLCTGVSCLQSRNEESSGLSLGGGIDNPLLYQSIFGYSFWYSDSLMIQESSPAHVEVSSVEPQNQSSLTIDVDPETASCELALNEGESLYPLGWRPYFAFRDSSTGSFLGYYRLSEDSVSKHWEFIFYTKFRMATGDISTMALNRVEIDWVQILAENTNAYFARLMENFDTGFSLNDCP